MGESSTPSADPKTRERLRDVSGTPREQASRLISLLFLAERAAAIDAEFGEVVAAARAKLSPDLLGRQWEALEGWEGREASDVARISAPALVATGEEDVVFPAANATALANTIPGAWLAASRMRATDSWPIIPRRFAGLINRFLGVD